VTTRSPGVVHVIDDDASWRLSVQRLMSAAGYQVSLYESAEVFLGTATRDEPGCILLDIRMPGLTGLQLQQRLAKDHRALPIIFLTGHGDIPTSVQAMKAGAEDFLTKPVDTDVLFHAVEQAFARSRHERAIREEHAALQSRFDGLTPTERKVLALVIRGKLNKHIAVELGTAERTVKWHRHNLMEKLGVDSVVELVSLADKLGLVGTPASGHPEFE